MVDEKELRHTRYEAKYRFVTMHRYTTDGKETHYILVETTPDGGELPCFWLGWGLTFELHPDTSVEDAHELAGMMNKHIRYTAYTE